MQGKQIVSRDVWAAARAELLQLEKEATRLRDKINAQRLELPWVEITENYFFDTPSGTRSLAELFEGRSQLVVYHFMFAPGWEAGCASCSFLADHLDGTLVHLNNHDVSLLVVSRAPIREIEAYRSRMGWRFPWVSSYRSSFNYDFGVSERLEGWQEGQDPNNADLTDLAGGEQHGISAFFKSGDGKVFHTYSSYDRGAEDWLGTFMILDRAPLGRNENGVMNWVRRHDEYEQAAQAHCCAGQAESAS